MTGGVIQRKTVAACIIGNEILRGITLDTNSNYLAKKCFLYGLEMKKMVVIPDDSSTIITTVKDLSASFDHVFTSGGIGPTHDDITYESIAKAFGCELKLDELTLESMKYYHSIDNNPESSIDEGPLAQKSPLVITKGRKKMACLPFPNEIHRTSNLWVPLTVVNKNVYILPGVPSLFCSMLDSYFDSKFAYLLDTPFYTKYIFTKEFEGDISEKLQNTQNEYKNTCIIGSYPKIGHKHYSVKVSVEGSMESIVNECANKIRESINGWFNGDHDG